MSIHRDPVTYDKGSDAETKTLVNHVAVELESLLVDGVVFAAQGDDTRPRNGEAVRVDAELLHHCVLVGYSSQARQRGQPWLHLKAHLDRALTLVVPLSHSQARSAFQFP